MRTLNDGLTAFQKVFVKIVVCFSITVCFAGCANVFYLGDAFSVTSQVDLYYDESAIEKAYDLIGHGLGSGIWVSSQKIQKKLIEEAKARGADAILITGLGKSNISIGNRLRASEKQLNVVFLRYR